MDEFETFETFIARRDYRPSTVNAYRARFRHFGDWLRKNSLTPTQVTSAHMPSLIDYLENEAGQKASTATGVLDTLRVYYKWLVEVDLVRIAPDIPVRQQRFAPPEAASIEDIRAALAAAQNDRAWSLIAILAFNSLKISELLECNVSSLEVVDGVDVLRFRAFAGNNRLHYTVLAPEVAEVLRRYVGRRGGGPLFVSSAHHTRKTVRMHRSTATADITSAGKRAGLPYELIPMRLTYALPASSIGMGFSYRSVIRAIGIVQPKHSQKWLHNFGPPTEDHAAVRMARLVLHPPTSTHAYLDHVEALLADSDLPEAFAMAAAGAVFERHLRAMCMQENLPVKADSKEGSIAGYYSELHRAETITLNERQMAERIAEWRNNAVHGAFHLIHPGSAREAIRSINTFVQRHPITKPDLLSGFAG